uniref:Coatomer subunit delta n=1 Tax=Bursaphelenchus xylophilus TaxID=6326 RepID=A0A1I7SRW3_BURXY
MITVLKVGGEKTCHLKAVDGRIEYKFLNQKDYKDGCDPSPFFGIALDTFNFSFKNTPELEFEFKFPKVPDVTIQIGSNSCYTARVMFNATNPPPQLWFLKDRYLPSPFNKSAWWPGGVDSADTLLSCPALFAVAVDDPEYDDIPTSNLAFHTSQMSMVGAVPS